MSDARKALRHHLAETPLPRGADDDDVYRLLLAFEELGSNGIRHTGAPIRVRVDNFADGWLIDVSDERPEQPPVPALDRDPALGGHGLHFIAGMSAAFGWTVIGTRKHVWAVLRPAA